MDISALEEDATAFANIAVQCDQRGAYSEAVFYYNEAAQALVKAHEAGSKLNCMMKCSEYLARLDKINSLVDINQHSPKVNQYLAQAQFLLTQALDEDELGNKEQAKQLYMEAAEMCIGKKSELFSLDKITLEKLNSLAINAVERAEGINASTRLKPDNSVSSTKRTINVFNYIERQSAPCQISDGNQTGGDYNEEEIKVLRFTSTINEREYVPFLHIDLTEKFGTAIPYCDPHGKLKLALKQTQRLKKWARISDISDEPKLIYVISPFSIRQTLVSDCSFIASLTISAAYERRFSKKILTKIIYPQDRRGNPVYNPCGKYMIKLHINGVWRKVVIDDMLPVNHNGDVLCSYSSNRNEFWVSILEKAYMKVMGGYDFPGSNSNIDLNSLTGWIPDRISIKSSDFDKDAAFDMMRNHFVNGNILITVATGNISKDDAERAGLVETHAYALLDIRKLKDGRKMFQLRNPWSHVEWKGKFSDTDYSSWTVNVKRELNYDIDTARKVDNGVFWIDYESLCHFFDVFYLSWNPKMFSGTSCFHGVWPHTKGPKKDTYTMGSNPQYSLKVKTDIPCSVWILLTRHITDKDDFSANKEFITLLVYKGAKKVFFPYNPPPYMDGVRINSPHYLCKVKLNDPGLHQFILVISEFERRNTIYYTLRVYTSSEFVFNKLVDNYNVTKSVTSEWTSKTAGGCANEKSFSKNPVYQIKLTEQSNDILIELKVPKHYFGCIDLMGLTPGVKKQSSGAYKQGYTMLACDSLAKGLYNIVPSTFEANQVGPFILEVNCSSSFSFAKL